MLQAPYPAQEGATVCGSVLVLLQWDSQADPGVWGSGFESEGKGSTRC